MPNQDFEATRYVGDAIVRLTYTGDSRQGGAERPIYAGEIVAHGFGYSFDNVGGPAYGPTSIAVDASEAFDRAASAAIAFAIHEGGVVGQAIDEATQCALSPSGRYHVRQAPLRSNPTSFSPHLMHLYNEILRKFFMRDNDGTPIAATEDAIRAGASFEQIETVWRTARESVGTLKDARTDDLVRDLVEMIPEIRRRIEIRDNPGRVVTGPESIRMSSASLADAVHRSVVGFGGVEVDATGWPRKWSLEKGDRTFRFKNRSYTVWVRVLSPGNQIEMLLGGSSESDWNGRMVIHNSDPEALAKSFGVVLAKLTGRSPGRNNPGGIKRIKNIRPLQPVIRLAHGSFGEEIIEIDYMGHWYPTSAKRGDLVEAMEATGLLLVLCFNEESHSVVLDVIDTKKQHSVGGLTVEGLGAVVLLMDRRIFEGPSVGVVEKMLAISQGEN